MVSTDKQNLTSDKARFQMVTNYRFLRIGALSKSLFSTVQDSSCKNIFFI